MKRSEYEAKLKPLLASLLAGDEIGVDFAAREIAGATLLAGVVFDPEEEPLPERLEIQSGEIYDPDAVARGPWVSAARQNYRGIPDTREPAARVLREAVRRWNAFSEARNLVREALGVYGTKGEDYARLKKLERVLEGAGGA